MMMQIRLEILKREDPYKIDFCRGYFLIVQATKVYFFVYNRDGAQNWHQNYQRDVMDELFFRELDLVRKSLLS